MGDFIGGLLIFFAMVAVVVFFMEPVFRTIVIVVVLLIIVLGIALSVRGGSLIPAAVDSAALMAQVRRSAPQAPALVACIAVLTREDLYWRPTEMARSLTDITQAPHSHFTRQPTIPPAKSMDQMVQCWGTTKDIVDISIADGPTLIPLSLAVVSVAISTTPQLDHTLLARMSANLKGRLPLRWCSCSNSITLYCRRQPITSMKTYIIGAGTL